SATPFGSGVEIVRAARVATFCSRCRIASSLARAPYETVKEGSIRAVAVDRAGSVPVSPVYQITVLAVVPGTMPAAPKKGDDPPTRCGGLLASALKKSLDAATADAAARDVAPSVPIEAVSAV